MSDARAALRRSLLAWYARNGRASLPWRRVRDPYYTAVSEFMLQQTQVERVAERFTAFVARFPDFAALARASAAEVLREWKGLGYNARAVRLKALAQTVCREHAGRLPRDPDALRALPGVGAYTAAALRVFAFDLDDAPIDTNVRRIVQRIFFGLEYPRPATHRELDARARALAPAARMHDWYSALMDLGASVCTARAPKCLLCPLRTRCAAAPVDGARLERLRARSKTGRVAQTFERTARYARGRIVDRLRELPPGKRISLLDLHRALRPLLPDKSLADVRELVGALERDGLLARDGERIALPE